jgi:hypothetical protein
MVNENEKEIYCWRNTNSLSWGDTDLVFRDDVFFLVLIVNRGIGLLRLRIIIRRIEI